MRQRGLAPAGNAGVRGLRLAALVLSVACGCDRGTGGMPGAGGRPAGREAAAGTAGREAPSAGEATPGGNAGEPGGGTGKDGTGEDAAAADAAAVPEEAADAPGEADAGSGTVLGRVIYRGPLPERTSFYIAEASAEVDAHTVIVDPETGGLENAAVWIEGPLAPRGEPPAGRARLDQEGWMFEPHVLAVRAGQTVRFTNSDAGNHNVRSDTSGHSFNFATPVGAEVEREFGRPTGARPVRVQCDIHTWMRGWIYVFEHDWVDITGEDGRFRIEGVPAGRWTLRAHHADGEIETRAEVEVRPGGTAEVTLEMPPSPVAGGDG